MFDDHVILHLSEQSSITCFSFFFSCVFILCICPLPYNHISSRGQINVLTYLLNSENMNSLKIQLMVGK